MRLFSEFMAKRNIGKMKAQRDVKALIKFCRNDEYRQMRAHIVDALTVIGAPAVGELIEALQDQEINSLAAEALGNIGDKRAVEPLIEALEDSNNASWSAVKSLGKIGDMRAIQPLLEKADFTPAPTSEYLRAYNMLQLFEGTGSGDTFGYDNDLAAFLEAIHRFYKSNREIFAHPSDMKEVRRIDPLLSLMIIQGVRQIEAEIPVPGGEGQLHRLEALAQLGASEAIGPILKLMHYRALCYTIRPARLLHDVWRIARVDFEKEQSSYTLRPTVADIFGSEPSKPREPSDAEKRLRHLKDPMVVKTTLSFRDAPQFREDVGTYAGMLASIGPSAVQPILNLLQNRKIYGWNAIYGGYWFIRKSFVESLGLIGDLTAIPFLEVEAKTTDLDVRKAAIDSLKLIQEKERM